MTRRELVLQNLRDTALWCVVTVPFFAATVGVSFLTLGWGSFVMVPFVFGPVYLMIVAGLSQRKLPDSGWLWYLILCFAGAGSAFMSVFLSEPLQSLFATENAYWAATVFVAGGMWVLPTLFNMGYLLSFSDEECAILTRNASPAPTETVARPRVAQV